MKLKLIPVFLLFIGLLDHTDGNLNAQEAVVEESQQTLKTYPFFDPNPIASIGRIYPYFSFDGYSQTGQPKEWKIITLENDYLKVFITPEIGGKIWGAMEKASEEMFFYFNHVVKFRNIAMRGPWTSGGIEINFGTIGHAPTCSSPVDYIVQENSDSSVSCIIGAMDLPSRTTWRVEIRLPKDKAYFETNVLWHNRSPLHQPYYHWMNSAARASDDLQLIFPGHRFIGHDGLAKPWPLGEGERNLSFYVNNNFGSYKSYHVVGETAGFFGGYYYDNQTGFGNWSLYTDKPGKKLWIWGLSRQGMIWENLLTDTDGQYIEWQSGRLFNQAAKASSQTPFKHRLFLPLSTDKWSEIWFPVKGTQGMAAASPFGTLNMKKTADQIQFYLCPLQRINDDLNIEVNGKRIYGKQIKLEPLQEFTDSIRYSGSEKISITLGTNKLNYSSPDENSFLNRPLKIPDEFDWHSAQALSITAREEYKQRNYDEALLIYSACLEKDPFYSEALTAMAELHFRRMAYDSALTYARRALALDTYDGAANFIYGVINRQVGLEADAADGFSLAAQSMQYRSAAYAQLAEMAVEKENWHQAEAYASRSLDYNRFNLTAHQVLVIACRKQGQLLKAQKSIEEVLKIDPLNHFARFEKYLLGRDQKLLQDFQKLVRGEFPAETYLELAVHYYTLGLTDESMRVLDLAPVNPIVYYWRAYLAAKTDDSKKSKDVLRKADVQSPHLIFPFRYETADVLDWARDNSDSWKPDYYLALIYWNSGRIEEAGELLMDCRNIPDYAPFYLTRAKFTETNDPSSSIRDSRQAIDLDKTEWRAWLILSRLYDKMGDQKNSLDALQTIYKVYPDDYRLAVPYAQALNRSLQYTECLRVLEKTDVLPFEGAGGARTLYNRVHLILAMSDLERDDLQAALTHLDKSKLWPENLGAGKPYEVDERLENYLEMIIRKRLNQKDKSEKCLTNIISLSEKFQTETGPNQLISALALNQKGKRAEALLLIDEWATVSTDSELAFWAVALFNRNIEDENRFFQKIKDRPDIQIYLKAVSLTILN